MFSLIQREKGDEADARRRHTQGIGTQVLVAAHPLPVRLVERRVARHVLRFSLLLLLSSTAEHLVEEPELRGYEGREEGDEKEGERCWKMHFCLPGGFRVDGFFFFFL